MSQAAAGFESPAEPPEPDTTPRPESTVPAPERARTAGGMLQQAREAAGFSRADVAGKLKFSVKQIEAVESDNYTSLGGKTFVRGLVRTYAKLLTVEVAPILGALEASELPPETGQVVADPKGVPFPTNKPQPSPVLRYTVISMGVIAFGLMVLYLWHGEEFLGGPSAASVAMRQQTRTAASAAPAPQAGPGTSTAVNLSPTVIDTAPAAKPAAGAAQSQPAGVPAPATLLPALPAPAPQTAAPPAAPPAPVAAVNPLPVRDRAAAAPAADESAKAAPAARGSRRILMSFERSSWVEVRDASGRIVFSQLNAPGTNQIIEGRAPFELVIGNAGYVNLRYRDAPVDLKPYTKSDVARLSLN